MRFAGVSFDPPILIREQPSIPLRWTRVGHKGPDGALGAKGPRKRHRADLSVGGIASADQRPELP